MAIPTQDERLAFWKHAYARASFLDAQTFTRHVMEAQLPLTNQTRKAMTIAAVTAYGRPFKQRANVRLSEDIIPAEHRETHDSTIEMRDKVIAHRDLDGPVADWGFISQLEFVIGEDDLMIKTRSPVMTDEIAQALLPLLDWLIYTMNNAVEPFVETHLVSLASQPGIYVLQLGNHQAGWTTRIE